MSGNSSVVCSRAARLPRFGRRVGRWFVSGSMHGHFSLRALGFVHQRAFQAVGGRGLDAHIANLADQINCIFDMHGLQPGTAAQHLSRLAAGPVEQHFHLAARARRIEFCLLLEQERLQDLKPL